MKLTPWFPGTVKPVREGVYERTGQNPPFNNPSFRFAYWDGELWKSVWVSPNGEFVVGGVSNYQHSLDWRGEEK